MSKIETYIQFVKDIVCSAENKRVYQGPSVSTEQPNRKWILDTYAECLNAVRVPHARAPTKGVP
jgi:hypothetical protein